VAARPDAARQRDLGHRSAWIIGAVCPLRDTGVALVMTRLDTAAMNLFLAELAQAVAPGAHAVVLMDKAGWHIADELVVPANVTPVFLPPYSPELNPIERLWLYLKDNQLSHCVFDTTADIIDACCDAWNGLLTETGRIRSLCSYPGSKRSALNQVGIIHRPGEIVAARQLGPLLAQPTFQTGDQGRAQFLADGSPPFGAVAVDRPLDVEQGVDAPDSLQRQRRDHPTVLPCALRRAFAAISAMMKNGRRAWTSTPPRRSGRFAAGLVQLVVSTERVGLEDPA